MAQWYYKKGDEEHGPFSPKELKQLADSGEIGGTDFVRNDSMQNWTAANTVKGLLRVASTMVQPVVQQPIAACPPPLPAAASPQSDEMESTPTKSILGRLRTSAGIVFDATKAAGIAAALQAESAQISSIALPKAFAKLGDEIRQSNQFRLELPDFHQQIDALEQKLSENLDAAKQKEEKDGVKGAANSIARMTKLKAEEASLRLQRSKLLKELGAIAYEKYREKAGSHTVTSEIARLQKRLVELKGNVDRANTQSHRPVFSTRRWILGATVCFGVVLLTLSAGDFRVATKDGNSPEHLLGDSAEVKEGIANYAVLVSDNQQGKPIERHFGKTIVVSGVSYTKGKQESGSEISIECQDGMVAMCHFKSPDIWNTDQRQFSIAGTFSEVFIRGQLVLTDCQLVDVSSVKSEPPASNEELVKLATKIGTPLETPWWIEKKYNPSILNLKGFKSERSIVLTFDLETSKWMEANWLLPLVISLYDEDGDFLFRFETDERFTIDQGFHAQCRQAYESDIRRGIPKDIAAKNNSSLLKSGGNRLEYQVNSRVLRDTAAVQIGFYQSR